MKAASELIRMAQESESLDKMVQLKIEALDLNQEDWDLDSENRDVLENEVISVFRDGHLDLQILKNQIEKGSTFALKILTTLIEGEHQAAVALGSELMITLSKYSVVCGAIQNSLRTDQEAPSISASLSSVVISLSSVEELCSSDEVLHQLPSSNNTSIAVTGTIHVAHDD